MDRSNARVKLIESWFIYVLLLISLIMFVVGSLAAARRHPWWLELGRGAALAARLHSTQPLSLRFKLAKAPFFYVCGDQANDVAGR
jgi:hypothetical protein